VPPLPPLKRSAPFKCFICLCHFCGRLVESYVFWNFLFDICLFFVLCSLFFVWCLFFVWYLFFV
jgi:hypothetical protein